MTENLTGNQDQQKAIILNRGPALILAGPGSGKTFTIVERIRYLITHHGVNAENILVVTFTKAAARQMRERFQTRMGGMACPVNFGTFHAVFYHILQTSASYRSDVVLSEKEKKEYLQRVLLTMQEDFSKYDPVKQAALQSAEGFFEPTDNLAEKYMDPEWLKGLLGEFGFVKNAGKIPEGFSSDFLELPVFKKAFLCFQKNIHQEGRMDFDDFASHCLHLFQTKKEVLERWQDKFQYILVDEFQDINPTQYEVVNLLAAKHKNLFVVGDDDQSIYGFGASDPKIMQQFYADYPEAVRIDLSINYRCAPGIVDLAGRLISVNKQRFSKTIRCGKKQAVKQTLQLPDQIQRKSAQAEMRFAEASNIWKPLTADNSVVIGGFTDRMQQAAAIAEKLKTIREQAQNKEAAVIFRTNTDALPVAEALSKAGLPFFIQEQIKSPYDHFVCQDLLAYLRFAHMGQKRSDFYRIMNRPVRYLSRQAVLKPEVEWEELLSFYKEKSWMLPLIEKCKKDIGLLAGMDLYAGIYYIRCGIGYDAWMEKNLTGEAKKQAFEMADFLKNSVKDFVSLESFLQHVEDYEKQLEASNRKKGEIQKGKIALLTIHGAKGLEFDHVFLPDCNEGIIPHKKSMKADEVEEERRMFYVGMTRAKEKLYLGWGMGTADNPGFISRFLADLGYREPWRNS